MSRSLRFHPRAVKDLSSLQHKQYKQVGEKIFSLLSEPRPQDSRHMAGYPDYFRVHQGEFRVIYSVSETEIYIGQVGPKNDDEVYRSFARRKGQ